MDTEEQQQKSNDQKHELYSVYGKFAVKFEHVCFSIHTGNEKLQS